MASGIATATGIKDMPLIGGLAQMDGEAYFFLHLPHLLVRYHLSPFHDRWTVRLASAYNSPTRLVCSIPSISV